MQRKCKDSGASFEVSDEELSYLEQISPVFTGKKYNLSIPSISPEERQRRRLAFRFLRHLAKRKCDLSGRPIVSCYPENFPHKVYYADEWWSDKWDAMDYGMDYNPRKSFFEQFQELYEKVPVLHLFLRNNQNCEYVNGVGECKNCYLCFDMNDSEDCLYLTNCKYATTCMDCLAVTKSELCYECVDCDNCYDLAFSIRCTGCNNSLFLTDCRQCNNCIGCVNLVGKEYYIFNEKVTKERFERFKQTLQTSCDIEELEQTAKVFSLKLPKKYYFGSANEDFSGDCLQHANNCFNCFDAFEIENCNHCNYAFKSNNCRDCNYVSFGEWNYNCLTTLPKGANNICCMYCWSGSHDNLYCHLMSGSSNCFGCSGLVQKKYCILNKQYTKDDYEQLAAKIAEQMQAEGTWGEFFPPFISPSPLNRTAAQEVAYLTKEETLSRGYKWEDEASTEPRGEKYQVPSNIKDTTDEILTKILSCEGCSKNYKLVKRELELYRQMTLPVPNVCAECRHLKRLSKRTKRQLCSRTCAKCGGSFESSYDTERPEIIYCEKCYLTELY